MDIQEIIKQTEKLSIEDRQNLVNYLLTKYFDKNQSVIKQLLEELNKNKKSPGKKRRIGFLNGVEYFIAEDFDSPIDDLKNYM